MAPIVLCVVDGLRPEAVLPDLTPNLAALMARGRATLSARSVMPSVTLPCHMSIFHSVEPGRHGVVTNVWTPQVRPVPGLFEVARAAGLRTAAFYNWEELRDLWRPGSLETGFFWRDNKSPEGDTLVAEAAVQGLASDAIDLAFVYLGYVDEAGHRHGWLTPGYLEAVTHADACIGMLREAVGDAGAILVTADHGGHERSHGTAADADMLVPMLLAGRGVGGPGALEGEVTLLDVAPTLAALLGLASPPEWEGRALL
jgi:predicted AlkP superfamily pyrophosphatase or phosphodiesterase